MNDRVSRSDLEITENTVVEKRHIEDIKSTKPEAVTEVSRVPFFFYLIGSNSYNHYNNTTCNKTYSMPRTEKGKTLTNIRYN